MSKPDRFPTRLRKRLRTLHTATQPIDIDAPPDPHAIILDNFVTTVSILAGEDEQLALRDVAMMARGACKYQPVRWVASVLRFGDDSLAGNTTALVFKKGKILVVGALNFEHARMATQEYRLFLEQVPMVMTDPETHALRVATLEGRTAFANMHLWNVVTHTSLGVRPELSKVIELYPQASEWDPDLFPGLTLRVWLKKKSECTCVRKKKNLSCACNCTCLVFDTGKIVVTGTSNRKDSVLASECIRRFFLGTDHLHNHKAVLPTHLRYQARIAQRMAESNQMQIEFVDVLKQPEDADFDAGSPLDVFQHLDVEQAPPAKKAKTVDAPFIHVCLQGNMDMVRFMLKVHGAQAMLAQRDEQGRTALECIAQDLDDQARATDVMQSIVYLLQNPESLV